MEKKNFYQSEAAFYGKLAITAAGVYLIFRFGLPLFAPFVAAYLLAGILRPSVRFFKQRCHVPRVLSASILLVLFLAALCVLIFFLSRLLFQQISLFVQNYSFFQQDFFRYAGRICHCTDGWFSLHPGTSLQFLTDGLEFAGSFVETRLIPKISEASLSMLKVVGGFAAKAVFTFVATLLMLLRREPGEGCEKGKKKPIKQSMIGPGLRQILFRLQDTGVAFLKTQGILISLVAVVCTVGFFFVRPEYALLLGIFVAVFDAFPILGSGLILMPWAVISVFQGKVIASCVLFVMYLICLLIRQILEPKLLGNRIGLSALTALIAVYVGVELFGILGVVLGPFLFVVLQTVLDEMREITGKKDTGVNKT